MTKSVEDLPAEILAHIFSFLECNQVANHILWTCRRWHTVIVQSTLKDHLNKLAKYNADMKLKLIELGWKDQSVTGDGSMDDELIFGLYHRFKSFKIMIVCGDPYSSRTEVIDLLKPNHDFSRQNTYVLCSQHPSRYGSIGGILQGQPIIFGGYHGKGYEDTENERDYYSECFFVGQPNKKLKMIEKRYRAACVILNHQETAWIVGGEGSAYAKTTTEFVTLNKTSVRGPDLSFEAWGHGMVKCNETSIYIIGGQQNGILCNRTWIANPKNDYKMVEGPPMNVKRRGHSCGKLEKNGKTMLIVAGGYDESLKDLNSMEYLIPSDSNAWSLGPPMPFKLAGSSMVTSPSGKGIILIGGYNEDINEYSDKLIEFRSTFMEWVVLSQKLQYPRADHVALPIPEEYFSKLNEETRFSPNSRKRKNRQREVYQAGFS